MAIREAVLITQLRGLIQGQLEAIKEASGDESVVNTGLLVFDEMIHNYGDLVGAYEFMGRACEHPLHMLAGCIMNTISQAFIDADEDEQESNDGPFDGFFISEN